MINSKDKYIIRNVIAAIVLAAGCVLFINSSLAHSPPPPDSNVPDAKAPEKISAPAADANITVRSSFAGINRLSNFRSLFANLIPLNIIPSNAVVPAAANPDLTRINPVSTVAAIGSEIQSLVFIRNMPVVGALQLLAAKYNKNIVPSQKVTGSLTFTKLNNVSFDEALKAILGEEFKYVQEGNLIKVYTVQEYDQLKLSKNDITCKVFTIYYISAAEAQKMVKSVLSTAGKIEITTAPQIGVPIEETISSQKGGGDAPAINDMMVVCDYPDRLEEVEKIIKAIDIRPSQVLVEATIMTASLTEDMQFGIDWRTLKTGIIDELTDITYGTQDSYSFSGTSTKVGSSSLNGGMSIGLLRDDVAVFIRAIEEITDVTILANPKIMAANKQLGQVYIGTKVAYQSQTTQTDTSTTEQVKFLDTGTKLSFRPYIGDDGYIRMDIHPKDSSATLRSSGTSSLPDETSAELVTNVVVKDGETIVIGGLFRNKLVSAKKQVPLIGNLPLIGVLFRSKADETVREEVMVLLTPHIIGEPKQADGSGRAEDIARKMDGAANELSALNAIKLAQQYYQKAAINYVKGNNAEALQEVKIALHLNPTFLEALQLQEKISSEMDPSKKPVRKYIEEAEKQQTEKWRRK